MSEQQATKSVGRVYQIVWYAMMLVLALSIVARESGLDNRMPTAIALLSNIYIALIPVSLLAFAVVLHVKQARVSSVVSLILFLLWVGLRLFI